MRILIVEDEYKLADAIASRLKIEKYEVDIALDGEIGLDNAQTNAYDLIILDVMLPKINGFEILKRIKESNVDSKVIMLTAKSQIEDKLIGFDNGANDYLTKPFHIDELIARINVQLRRKTKTSNEYIEIGNTRLNIKNSTITCIDTNETIEIVGKEYLLLEYLMNNQNQIIEKDQLYNKVWGLDTEIESNNLEAYLSFIRRKLKAIDSNISIKALRGLGYKLEVKDEKTKK